jgi:hypothetical protein
MPTPSIRRNGRGRDEPLGSMPEKAEWQIPQVVESAEGRVISAAA